MSAILYYLTDNSCFKRKDTSKPATVYDFLERQDRRIFRKVCNAKGHPLLSIMPRIKPSSYNLRKETCFKPKINTMRFKTSFINGLVFKYELAMLYTRYIHRCIFFLILTF